MFSPTSFPAAAWRVTKALNVVPVTGLNPAWYSGMFVAADEMTFYREELFPDRAAAVEHAVARLAEDEARVARAIARHALRRAMVKRVVAAGGSGAVK